MDAMVVIELPEWLVLVVMGMMIFSLVLSGVELYLKSKLAKLKKNAEEEVNRARALVELSVESMRKLREQYEVLHKLRERAEAKKDENIH